MLTNLRRDTGATHQRCAETAVQHLHAEDTDCLTWGLCSRASVVFPAPGFDFHIN